MPVGRCSQLFSQSLEEQLTVLRQDRPSAGLRSYTTFVATSISLFCSRVKDCQYCCARNGIDVILSHGLQTAPVKTEIM